MTKYTTHRYFANSKHSIHNYSELSLEIITSLVSFFRTNKTYLHWKSDNNAIGMKCKMYIQEVKEDGITFVENTQPILVMSAESADDGLVVEGGSLLYKDGFYYLFFSANGYTNPKYHVSVARSKEVSNTDCVNNMNPKHSAQ